MPNVIARSDLHIDPRQRSSIDPQSLALLRDSILARGLLHAPVVRSRGDRGGFTLVAGGRRVAAIDAIWQSGGFIRYDNKAFFPGELPVSMADLEHASEWMSAEFEENMIREELPWTDRVRAIDAIHKQRLAENPQQSFQATARELIEHGASTVSAENTGREVKEAHIVAQHLDKYKVKTARNAHEAFQIVMQDEQKLYEAMLVKRRLAAGGTEDAIDVRLGDAFVLLPLLDGDRFDLILSDPPYGIGADTGGFSSRSVQHHLYEDTPERARLLLQSIIAEGFRLCKPRANIFLFTDFQHFDWLLTASSASGWVPWRTPIIWRKSQSEGLAPWGRSGFRRTYDILFFATKGQRGLIHSPVDILEASRVSRADRLHGAEKPVALLKQLIECSTLTGDSVLDPCCGVGSSLQAMRQTKRRGLGIELSPEYFNTALVRAHTDDPTEEEPANESARIESRPTEADL